MSKQTVSGSAATAVGSEGSSLNPNPTSAEQSTAPASHTEKKKTKNWQSIGGFPNEAALDDFIAKTRALVVVSEQCHFDASREGKKVTDLLGAASKFQSETQQRIGRRNKKLLENGRKVEAISKMSLRR
jgi:hypothetical protein